MSQSPVKAPPKDAQDALPECPLAAAKQINEAEAAANTPCIESMGFQLFGASLIISNAIVIGLETDLGDWKGWPLVENIFLLLFLIELLTKMCMTGPFTFIFTHADASWNSFDFFIVGLGVFDFTMEKLTGNAGAGSFATLFRIIRLLRILRIFRVLKFLKQLYVLAFGLAEACKAVFWVTILMLFVLYICSIVLVKTIGRPPEDDPHYEFINYRFGKIIDSMLTLFILMSSPNLPTYEDEVGFLQCHPFLTMFLCGFIIFGSFGIVALLTGVISESMFEKNEVRKEQVRTEHEAMRKSLGTKCGELFQKAGDFDENGEAKVEDVKKLAGDVWRMLEAVGAEITHADCERIIEFMDMDGKGRIGPTEFSSTIEKIAEGLSPLGVQEVANRVGICEQKIDKVQDAIELLSKQVLELGAGLQLLLDNQARR